jgi:hypothetical protein
MAIYYAGIGSRETPKKIINVMEEIALVLGESGLILRSGHANGADQAFECGAQYHKAEICLPWVTYNAHIEIPNNHDIWLPNVAALKSVKEYHPAGSSLTYGAKKLHARNSQIILGENLDNTVSFIVCWTPLGKGSGGTGQAIRIANKNAIFVYDLGNRSLYDLFMKRLEAEDLPGMKNYLLS